MSFSRFVARLFRIFCIFANFFVYINNNRMMKMNKVVRSILLVVMGVISTSCITSKDVRYLQDMPLEGMPVNENLEATVAPYDELRIYVLSNTGKDDELIKPFNVLGGNISQANTAQYGYGYLVDVNGNIQFPVLGELHVEGLTRLQLQDSIAAHLERNGYIKNPLVVVRFMNFKVFFLSSSGGKVLNINEERCTFLEALAMSGGLDWYTRRDRIGVMREVDGKRVVHYLDPRSTDIFNDDFFVLQQNDIIFTEERGYKFLNNNLSPVLTVMSAITSFVAFYTLLRSFFPTATNGK